uniref:Chemokine interleukin-8-like domain-containing protein n=1 Tax=Cyprinus carpio TaxID=7962 RepID=A0A8C1N586_CYPCA
MYIKFKGKLFDILTLVLIHIEFFQLLFYKKKIPLNLVVSFYQTGSNCPISAIVFRTAAGREFCLDPDSSWVKKHIAKVNTASKAVFCIFK